MSIEEIYEDLKSCNNGLPLVNKEKAAKLLNCSVSLINKNMGRGLNIPPYLKIGGKVQFHLMDIAEFLENKKVVILNKDYL